MLIVDAGSHSGALLAPQEVQQLVVDVPGALLLRPVAAVGQQDDPAQVRHRRIAPPADEQGRLSHAGRPDLGVLVPVAVLVAVDAQRPLEPGAGVRPGVLVQVLLAEPARQLLGLRHAVQHTPGRSWVFEQARDQVGRGVTRKGVQEAAHGPARVSVELRLGDAQRVERGGATWDELPQHLAGGAGSRDRYVTLSATNPATRCGNSSAHAQAIFAPQSWPTSTAVSAPRASRRPTTSAARFDGA